MGLFKKKPKERKTLVDSAKDLKNEVEGTLLPAEIGVDPDEIERLLELLGRDNGNRVVFRRRVGSIIDVAKGLVFWLRPYRLTLNEAKELIHKNAERQRVREAKLLKKRRRKNPDFQLPKYITPDEIEYPSKLSPDDVLAAFEAAKRRLEETSRQIHADDIEERRAKQIFVALDQMKKEEATRFARRVAMMQRHHIEGKPSIDDEKQENGEKGSNSWAAHDLDDELEQVRTLHGFGKKQLKTLIDEAGDVVDTNVEAAAKVVQQWIGNQEKKET